MSKRVVQVLTKILAMSFRVSLQEQHGVALPHLFSARRTHWNRSRLAVSDNISSPGK